MEQNQKKGVLDMTGYLDKSVKTIILLFLFPLYIFANDNESFETDISIRDNTLRIDYEMGIIENLTYKTIKEIQESNLLGNLVDMYLPNILVNCYIFHFKKERTIYQIAALPENDIPEISLVNIDLEQFYAIGYYGIIYPDREKYNMFRGPSTQTPFDFLHELNPENYVSIAEVEIMADINFILVDRGGFLSPFYLYKCDLENGLLSVLASPSEDKAKSFFMGGWSFVEKNNMQIPEYTLK